MRHSAEGGLWAANESNIGLSSRQQHLHRVHGESMMSALRGIREKMQMAIALRVVENPADVHDAAARRWRQLKGKVQYRRDPGRELVRPMREMEGRLTGDCEDLNLVLLGGLVAMEVGVKYLHTVGIPRGNPRHVVLGVRGGYAPAVTYDLCDPPMMSSQLVGDWIPWVYWNGWKGFGFDSGALPRVART